MKVWLVLGRLVQVDLANGSDRPSPHGETWLSRYGQMQSGFKVRTRFKIRDARFVQ